MPVRTTVTLTMHRDHRYQLTAHGHGCGSIATAADADLAITCSDGRLTALNSSTGRRLWEFQTGAGMNSPVSIFEYEGIQYVVAYSAGSLFAGTTHGDSVWLFSTKGTLPESEQRSTR